MSTLYSTTSSATPSGSRAGFFGIREWLMKKWLKNIERGCLTLTFPSGAQQDFKGIRDGTHACMHIHNMRVVTRILSSGDLGLAESYMAGEWETPDLSALLTLGSINTVALKSIFGLSSAAQVLSRTKHAWRANSRRGSRRNIAAHYDLGNAFYQIWLDESMTYSSAIFNNPNEAMDTAQRRKYLRIAQRLDLKPGDQILEVGCGWGGFAEIAAAEFGCHVVGLTLSREQASYARQRMIRRGIADRVDIRLQDYRDTAETFDKIVSIEMFEAVGEKYWPTFFQTLNKRLKLNGRAALQIITIDDCKFDFYKRNPDFIQKYIFPGGMLPSLKAFSKALKRGGFGIEETFSFGTSYSETLRRWDQNFRAQWPEIEKLGFDKKFYRMWHYYLRYCEVGFDDGTIDVGQFIIKKS
ncbi:MAG: SAM-dependent methyltransferase [Rhodospirillaceae bacterium TMED8]|nr:SAM-dependent methyltransferase [Magnetovibrio sp.]OUT49273.1 MAG: SAM-dependent methyltransferase [Rhodospirillaceae bacterium TMED8]